MFAFIINYSRNFRTRSRWWTNNNLKYAYLRRNRLVMFELIKENFYFNSMESSLWDSQRRYNPKYATFTKRISNTVYSYCVVIFLRRESVLLHGKNNRPFIYRDILRNIILGTLYKVGITFAIQNTVCSLLMHYFFSNKKLLSISGKCELICVYFYKNLTT